MVHHRALSESEILDIFNSASVNPLNADLLFKESPNDEMIVRFANSAYHNIVIYNATGQMVKSLESNSDTEVIDMSSLDQGLYYVHVKDGNSSVVKKVVKF